MRGSFCLARYERRHHRGPSRRHESHTRRRSEGKGAGSRDLGPRSAGDGSGAATHTRGCPCPYFLVGARLYARLVQQGLLYRPQRDFCPPMSGSLVTARQSASGARSQRPKVGSHATGPPPGSVPSRMKAGHGHGWTWGTILETGPTLVRGCHVQGSTPHVRRGGEGGRWDERALGGEGTREKRSGVSRRGDQETAVMRAHVPGAEGCLRMRNDQEASACIALAWGTVGRRARRVQPPAPVPGPIPGHCEEWEP